jgi:hypothetical protein
MKCRVLAILLLVATLHARAQDIVDSTYLTRDEFRFADDPRYTLLGGTPRRVTEIQPLPTIALGAAYTGLFMFLNHHMSNSWWQRSVDFRVIEDGNYAKGADKVGHTYTGYVASTVCGDLLMECGFDYTTSTWLGAAMGLGYMTYVEYQDGHGANWGFSPTDAIANTAGAAVYVARNLSPFAQNFMPRWSYMPANVVGEQPTNGREVTVLDDYNATTFWLACNVHNLLPQSAKPYWPDWMMISVGYGIRNYEVYPTLADGTRSATPLPIGRRFLLGIDYNWVKILPEAQSMGFLNYLRQGLNYVRLPGPTLEFGDDGVRFGLFYPFAIVVPF